MAEATPSSAPDATTLRIGRILDSCSATRRMNNNSGLHQAIATVGVVKRVEDFVIVSESEDSSSQ
jgi:hypothetical protein